MAAVLAAGSAVAFFLLAFVLFGAGGADRFAISASLIGLIALSMAVLAHVVPRPPTDPGVRS